MIKKKIQQIIEGFGHYRKVRAEVILSEETI